MNELNAIVEGITAHFEEQNSLRDEALNQTRLLIRDSARTIQAIHRREWDEVKTQLENIRASVREIEALLSGHPDLYYAGYTQDALKEYAEASLMYALVHADPLPTPNDLGVIPSTYINGLAEAATELRRHILDAIRKEERDEAERMLNAMDTIYDELMTISFPDALTGGLRRRVDTVRSVLERTRGDVTMSFQQQSLERALHLVEQNTAE